MLLSSVKENILGFQKQRDKSINSLLSNLLKLYFFRNCKKNQFRKNGYQFWKINAFKSMKFFDKYRNILTIATTLSLIVWFGMLDFFPCRKIHSAKNIYERKYVSYSTVKFNFSKGRILASAFARKFLSVSIACFLFVPNVWRLGLGKVLKSVTTCSSVHKGSKICFICTYPAENLYQYLYGLFFHNLFWVITFIW